MYTSPTHGSREKRLDKMPYQRANATGQRVFSITKVNNLSACRRNELNGKDHSSGEVCTMYLVQVPSPPSNNFVVNAPEKLVCPAPILSKKSLSRSLVTLKCILDESTRNIIKKKERWRTYRQKEWLYDWSEKKKKKEKKGKRRRRLSIDEE